MTAQARPEAEMPGVEGLSSWRRISDAAVAHGVVASLLDAEARRPPSPRHGASHPKA